MESPLLDQDAHGGGPVDQVVAGDVVGGEHLGEEVPSSFPNIVNVDFIYLLFKSLVLVNEAHDGGPVNRTEVGVAGALCEHKAL